VNDAIFSFGTLQLDGVQRSLFGRAVPTTPDALRGWTVGQLTIVDPEVITLSGTDIHPALIATGRPEDVVEGAVLDVSAAELAAADHYERVSYERAAVTLVSGRRAWIYVSRAPVTPPDRG